VKSTKNSFILATTYQSNLSPTVCVPSNPWEDRVDGYDRPLIRVVLASGTRRQLGLNTGEVSDQAVSEIIPFVFRCKRNNHIRK
jgi:hypothetical protein